MLKLTKVYFEQPGGGTCPTGSYFLEDLDTSADTVAYVKAVTEYVPRGGEFSPLHKQEFNEQQNNNNNSSSSTRQHGVPDYYGSKGWD